MLPKRGSELVGALIYEKDKTTYRSEIDQALRTKPDFLYLNGYAPDVTVMLRDLYRAGFDGGRMTQSYALTSKVLESLPPEVTEGVYTDAALGRHRLARLRARRQAARHRRPGLLRDPGDRLDQPRLPDHRQGQGGDRHGVARQRAQDLARLRHEGLHARSTGLKALAEGKEINYEGASGPCDFTDIGDIIDCKFRYQQVDGGKFKFLKIA